MQNWAEVLHSVRDDTGDGNGDFISLLTNKEKQNRTSGNIMLNSVIDYKIEHPITSNEVLKREHINFCIPG